MDFASRPIVSIVETGCVCFVETLTFNVTTAYLEEERGKVANETLQNWCYES